MLVTKLDFKDNCKNQSVVCSQDFFSTLSEAPRYKNMEEGAAVANIVLMCMRYDWNFRSHISEAAPVAELLRLLRCNHKQSTFNSLELFNEMLHVPRARATNLLHQLRLAGKTNVMHYLMACLRKQTQKITSLQQICCFNWTPWRIQGATRVYLGKKQ